MADCFRKLRAVSKMRAIEIRLERETFLGHRPSKTKQQAVTFING